MVLFHKKKTWFDFAMFSYRMLNPAKIMNMMEIEQILPIFQGSIIGGINFGKKDECWGWYWGHK